MCFFCLPCLGSHLELIGGANWRGCRDGRRFALAGCACYTIVPIASTELWIVQIFMEEMSFRRWWHLYCTHIALSVPLLWFTCLCHRRWIVTTCLPPSLALFESSLLWTCLTSHLIAKSIATRSLSKRACFCCIALNWVSSRLYCASELSIFMHVDHPTAFMEFQEQWW